MRRESYSQQRINHLNVMVVHKPDYQQMSAILTCGFGSCHHRVELEEQTTLTIPLGTAHFIEHQLFIQEDGSDVSESFSELGARVNAFTTGYQTGYCVTTAVRHHEALALLINFVQSPHFTQGSVALEKDIIMQELKLYEDDPFSSGYQSLMKQLYPAHPIGEDIVGTEDSIQSMSVEQLTEAYELFYDVSRMQLVVVGNLSQEEVAHVVQSSLKPISSYKTWRLLDNSVLPTSTNTLYQTCEVSQPILMVGVRFKGVNSSKEMFYQTKWCFELLSELLFGPMSNFYEQYEEKGWIDTSFHYTVQMEADVHCLVIECMSDKKVVSELCQTIKDAIEHWQLSIDLTEQQFNRMIRGKIGDLIRERNDVEALANSIAQEGVQYLDSVAYLQQLQLQDLIQYAQEYWQDYFTSSVIIS